MTDALARRTDPDLRCATWTRAEGVDPIGSATRFEHLILVEWPLPWPADVGDIPELAELAADGRARVMVVVPRLDDWEEDGRATVVHHRRVGRQRLIGVDHRVDTAAVPSLVADLLDHVDEDTAGWPSAVGAAPPEVLICGHGRRDPCCGRWGTLLHVELLARGGPHRVWRCSHTGGHRFAPTAITLPDGRVWGYLDADLLTGILRRDTSVDALHDHDRGASGLDQWAQVVERVCFEHAGWPWLDHEITAVRTDVAEDGRSATAALTWQAPDGSTGTTTGVVEVVRDVPVLVCGEPPEAAKKTSPELALRSVAQVLDPRS